MIEISKLLGSRKMNYISSNLPIKSEPWLLLVKMEMIPVDHTEPAVSSHKVCMHTGSLSSEAMQGKAGAVADKRLPNH
jgi:hypothetical protein